VLSLIIMAATRQFAGERHTNALALGLGGLGSAMLGAVLVAWPTGCSTVDETGTGAAAPTTTTSGGGTTTTSSGGSGGTGGEGASNPCPEGGFAPYVPTPQDIGFTAVHPVPQGEQILFNDWASPDSVYSLTVDGQTATEIFRAFRVWSLGVANGAGSLAFACGDPHQAEHYGISVGDAIQHTWLYDFASQSLTLLADGLINDECHTFAADDSSIYVCRRYDWQCDPEWYTTNKGYRIGRIELPSKTFSFITAESATNLDLYPQPNSAGTDMLFTRVVIQGNQQSRSIQHMALPSGAPALVRDNANAPVLSPDGLRYAYTDYNHSGRLYVSDLDGSNEVLVAQDKATSVRFSPDGTKVAYLSWDDNSACSHIMTAAVDGSEAQAPTRLRDCGISNEFISELAWFVRP
jgi:hypothetical protein